MKYKTRDKILFIVMVIAIYGSDRSDTIIHYLAKQIDNLNLFHS